MGALSILVAKNINARTSFQMGLLLSVAVLIRLNLAYLVIVIGGFLCTYPFFIQKRSPVKIIVMYGVGGLIPLTIVILPYAIGGELDTLFNSLVVLPLQYSSSQQSAIESLKAVLIDIKIFGSRNALLWIGFLGGIVVMALNWNNYTSTLRFRILLITIFFLGVMLAIINNGIARYDDLAQIVALMSLPGSLFYSVIFQRRYKPILTFVFILALTMPSYKVLSKYGQLASMLVSDKPLLSDGGYKLAAYIDSENPTKEPVYFMVYHIAQWLTDTKPMSKIFTHPDNLGRSFMLKVLVDSDANTATELRKLLDKKPLFIVADKDAGFLQHDPEAVRIFNNTLQTDYFYTKRFDKAYVYKRKADYIEH